MKTIVTIAIMLVALTFGNTKAQENYYFSKKIEAPLEAATDTVKKLLKEQGFGIINTIDMHETLNEKLEDAELKPYRILGACNPKFAHQAIQAEENIGLFLPCKVLIKELDNNTSEVVLINPSMVMEKMDNEELMNMANEVSKRFKKVIDML